MRMHVPLATLATLLDFPRGAHVVGVELAGDGVDLALAGEIALEREGVPAGDGDQVSAEYSVDAKSHRSFTRWVLPDTPAMAAEETTDPGEPVTETVGSTTPAKAAGATKKAGS